MKKTICIAFVVMCILFIIGIVLIFSAPSAGENAGIRAIQNHGGGMDTNHFVRIIESTTKSYQTGGLVISLVGGFGLILNGYFLIKLKTN